MNDKPLILVVASLLVVTLVCISSLKSIDVSADKSNLRCSPEVSTGNGPDTTHSCCWDEGGRTWCVQCITTGLHTSVTRCSDPTLYALIESAPPPPTLGKSPQPPKNVLPSPSTTCPDGSQPDANGNCPTSTGGTTSHPPLSPLTSTKNQGGSSSTNNNNNNAGTNPIKHCSKTNAGGPHCPKAG
jgi:hypothetical protein